MKEKKNSTTSTRKELTQVYRVPLSMSARMEGTDVAGREQTTGSKETTKHKRRLQVQTSKRRKILIHRLFGTNSIKE
jgi:hypothetical protein